MFNILFHHLLISSPGRNKGRQFSTRFCRDPARGRVAAGAMLLAGSITVTVGLMYVLKTKEGEEPPPPIPGFRG